MRRRRANLFNPCLSLRRPLTLRLQEPGTSSELRWSHCRPAVGHHILSDFLFILPALPLQVSSSVLLLIVTRYCYGGTGSRGNCSQQSSSAHWPCWVRHLLAIPDHRLCNIDISPPRFICRCASILFQHHFVPDQRRLSGRSQWTITVKKKAIALNGLSGK